MSRFFVYDGWPHTSAVIVETANGQAYAVDSWFHDNGQPAEVVPLEQWVAGWGPDEILVAAATEETGDGTVDVVITPDVATDTGAESVVAAMPVSDMAEPEATQLPPEAVAEEENAAPQATTTTTMAMTPVVSEGDRTEQNATATTADP